MYWFRRPPYLRWTAAAALVTVALWSELRGPAQLSHPFAARDLEPGSALSAQDLRWRAVPAGLLPAVDLGQSPVLNHPLREGEPLLPSLVESDSVAVPEGWWALPLSLPAGALPGTRLRLVVVPLDPGEEPLVIPGLVVRAPDPSGDLFSFEGPVGLAAVPEEAAPMVAVAAAEQRVVVGLDR